ncbi:MAG TPA: hypothetical protein VN944_11325, partial [Nitrospiria bacterium]|nr:hypothetical protein [Nitrospiria bacterium]
MIDPSSPSPARVDGIPDAFKAFLISTLSTETDRPVIVLAPTPEEAEKLIGDIQFFFSMTGRRDEVCYFPALEIVPYEQVDPPPALVAERTRTIQTLGKLREKGNAVIVSTAQAILSPLPDLDQFDS